MTTNSHPLIGKRIEATFNESGRQATVLDVRFHEGGFYLLVENQDGVIIEHEVGDRWWRTVTPDSAAEPTTAAPQPDADGWIPLDGTRFPDVEPSAEIVVRFRHGKDDSGPAGEWDYPHTGSAVNIIAWKRA
jgi:hypothetical protein